MQYHDKSKTSNYSEALKNILPGVHDFTIQYSYFTLVVKTHSTNDIRWLKRQIEEAVIENNIQLSSLFRINKVDRQNHLILCYVNYMKDIPKAQQGLERVPGVIKVQCNIDMVLKMIRDYRNQLYKDYSQIFVLEN